MKKIGLLGGMSWESTVSYYQMINEEVRKQLGGLHSAEIILYSLDFQPIEHYQQLGEWDRCAELLVEAALALQKAGAELIVICSNTMHKVAQEVQQHLTIPLIHVAQATVKQINLDQLTKVALLGTKYTMLQDFYKSHLQQAGIEVLIPDEQGIEVVNRVIYEELCLGIINSESKQQYLEIIDQLAQQGAQGVILGCTEIGLLIKPQDTPLAVYDTTMIHSQTAALYALDKLNLSDIT